MIQDFDEFVKLMKVKDEERCKEQSKYDYAQSFDYFMKLNGVDEDTITEDMMNWYAYHICDKKGFFCPFNIDCYAPNINNYVNEMLEKTSLDLLVKQLNRDLPGTGKHKFVTNYTDRDEKINVLVVSKEVYDRDKIFQICDRMMWSFTGVDTGDGQWTNPNDIDEPHIFTDWGLPLIKILVEPVKTKNITDFIMNNCGGKIYHLCFKKDVENILKCGLRVRGKKNIYRFIDDRVYFVCGETKKDIVDNIIIVLNSKTKSNKDLKIDDFTVLEIDVNGYNIDFYQDGCYLEDVKYIGYTYNYFPPSRLRVVDINDFKSGK